MTEMKPCPIPGCGRKWKTVDGLMAHLFQRHRKAELIKWILQRLEKPNPKLREVWSITLVLGSWTIFVGLGMIERRDPCEAWKKRVRKFMEMSDLED